MNFVYSLVAFIALCLVVLPVLIGTGISLLIGFTGIQLFMVIIICCLFIWALVFILIYH